MSQDEASEEKLYAQGDFKDCRKAILDPQSVGVYLFIYETTESEFPERDYLQDDLEMAREMALEDFQIPLTAWRPCSD